MGGAKDCLDNLCDRAPDGELEVAGGVLRYEHDCNWKFILENLNDTMHPMVAHESVVKAAEAYIDSLPPNADQARREAEILLPFGSSYENFEDSVLLDFGTVIITTVEKPVFTQNMQLMLTIMPQWWQRMVKSGLRKSIALIPTMFCSIPL